MRLSCPEQMLALYPLETRLQIIETCGFDGFDCRSSLLDHPEMARIIRDFRLPLASVYSQIRSPSLLDASAADRARALSDVLHRARLAADHGAENLILVPVFGESRLTLDLSPDETIDLESALLLVYLKEIADCLTDVPITVIIEPLNQSETHFLTEPSTAASFCHRIASPRVATMVDTYHCFQERLDCVAQIESMGEQLSLVHLSDSARGLPGEGEVDFSAVMRKLAAIGFTGWLGFECREISSDAQAQRLGQAVSTLRSMVPPVATPA